MATFNITLALLLPLSDTRLASEAFCSGFLRATHYWDESSNTCVRLNFAAIAAMSLQATEDFNARAPYHVPEFASLGSCDKRFSLQILDFASDAQQVVNSAIELVSGAGPPPNIVISSAISEQTRVVAPILDANAALHLSGRATSSELDKLERFMRTDSTDEAITDAICALWALEMGFKEAFIIYVSDAFGSAFNAFLVKSCLALGVSVASFEFQAASEGSIQRAVDKLAGSGLRVGVVASHGTDNAKVAEEMFKAEVIGGNESSMLCFTSRNIEFRGMSRDAAAAISGSMHVLNIGGMADNSQWRAFETTSWPALPIDRLNAHLPGIHLPLDIFSSSRSWTQEPRVRDTGAFQFDAIAAAGLLACEVAPTGALPANFSSLVWEARERLSFNGLSGRVSFDAVGNRDVSTANIALYNLLKRDIPWSGGGMTSMVPVLRATYDGGAWRWKNGSLAASGLLFTGEQREPPAAIVRVTIIWPMSDSTITNRTRCEEQGAEHTWVAQKRTCYRHSDQDTAPMAMALAAVEAFNSRSPRLVPRFGELQRCDKRIAITAVDSGSTTSASVGPIARTVADDLARPDAIIGPRTSRIASMAAPFFGDVDIPSISFSATSAHLDDTRTFPRFMRTIPTDAYAARTLCEFWSELSYSRAFVIFVNDDYGLAFNAAVVSSCRARDIAVASYAFEHASHESITSAVDRLATSRTHVGLIVSVRSYDAMWIAQRLHTTGVVGGSARSFTVFSENSQHRLSELDDDVRRAFSGSVQLRQSGRTADNLLWRNFKAAGWWSLDPSTLNAHLPTGFQLADDFFNRSVEGALEQTVRHQGAFALDAVAAVGLLACQQAPVGPLPADFGKRFWGARQNISFESLTGRMEFDSVGNRDESTVNVEMYNLMLRGDTVTSVHRATFDGQVWHWEHGSRAASGLLFNGESETPPVQPRDKSTASNLVTIYSVTAIVLSALVGTATCLVLRRRRGNTEAAFRMQATGLPAEFNLSKDCHWHIFLSHKWPTGQEPCARIREKLLNHAPGVRIFLDVHDLEDTSQLETYIERSASVCIFLSSGYFKSRNCMREVRAAVKHSKPLILVHDADPLAGGAPLQQLQAECPDELRDLIFGPGHRLIPWLRSPDFQMAVLLDIAEAMHSALPRASSAYSRLYIPRTLASQSFLLAKPLSIYVSPHNLGAEAMATRFLQQMRPSSQASVVASPPAILEEVFRDGVLLPGGMSYRAQPFGVVSMNKRNSRQAGWQRGRLGSLSLLKTRFPLHVEIQRLGECFLLYLEPNVFNGGEHAQLCAEVAMALQAGYPVIMVHPVLDVSFHDLIDTCRSSDQAHKLVELGIFDNVAVPWRPVGAYERVSAGLLAKNLGALSSAHRWRGDAIQSERFAGRASGQHHYPTDVNQAQKDAAEASRASLMRTPLSPLSFFSRGWQRWCSRHPGETQRTENASGRQRESRELELHESG